MTNQGATMNIPEEVLIAAARALNDSSPLVARWENAPSNVREMRLDQARAALSALTPLLIKQVLAGALESHAPKWFLNEQVCNKCLDSPGSSFPAPWPCPTSQAIADALKEQP